MSSLKMGDEFSRMTRAFRARIFRVQTRVRVQSSTIGKIKTSDPVVQIPERLPCSVHEVFNQRSLIHPSATVAVGSK
jgi:hypothetical protein